MAAMWRFLGWALILLITACWVGCIAAVGEYLTSTKSSRGFALLALPGLSVIAAPAGLALWPIRYFVRNTSRRWERVTLVIFAILGPLPLIALVIYDAIWH